MCATNFRSCAGLPIKFLELGIDMGMTISISIRLKPKEKNALFALAKKRKVSSSELIRRLIREAVFHGPTFFDEDLSAITDLKREVNRTGRNLNQIARRVNSGAVKTDPLNALIIKEMTRNQMRMWETLHDITLNSRFRRSALRKSSIRGFDDYSKK